jgi:hypothetical protein
MTYSKIYRNPTDQPVSIKDQGLLIRLDPWRQGELLDVKGCTVNNRKLGLCLRITPILKED